MRELHESVYRCAAVIHANIVSNKASVNNQKLRHSLSANSKSVGPTNSGYSLTSYRHEKATDPREKYLSYVTTADQFNFCRVKISARKVPLLRHTTADQFSFRLSTAGKAYPRRHTTAVQKHSIFRRKESRRSRT